MARLLAWLLLLWAPAIPAATPEAVTILRDAYGVPHIFTSGRNAAVRGAFAYGYAEAEDRLFQMDILRRAATGRLAEMLGPDYLLMDEVNRRDGFTLDERQQIFGRLGPRDRRLIEAFRDGVNAFIERVTVDPALLPFEFTGTPPAPWDVADSVAVAVLEFVVFGANGGGEVLNADQLLDLESRFPEAEAHGIFDDLHWIEDPAAPTTIEGFTQDPDVVMRYAPVQL